MKSGRRAKGWAKLCALLLGAVATIAVGLPAGSANAAGVGHRFIFSGALKGTLPFAASACGIESSAHYGNQTEFSWFGTALGGPAGGRGTWILRVEVAGFGTMALTKAQARLPLPKTVAVTLTGPRAASFSSVAGTVTVGKGAETGTVNASLAGHRGSTVEVVGSWRPCS